MSRKYYLHVDMDFESFKIPLEVISEMYFEEYPEDIGTEVLYELYEDILDFAQNSLDWDDVKDYAVKVETRCDRNTSWYCADMCIK